MPIRMVNLKSHRPSITLKLCYLRISDARIRQEKTPEHGKSHRTI